MPTWDSPRKIKFCGTFEEAFPVLKELNLDNLLTIPHKSCVYANSLYLDDSSILRDVDTYDYIRDCDLIIGDTSSILMESIVFNKPIIQINKCDKLDGFINWFNHVSPKVEIYKNLFSLYTFGEIIPLDKNIIIKTIELTLNNPNKYKYLRDYYKTLFFYNLGSSLQTSIQALEKIYHE